MAGRFLRRLLSWRPKRPPWESEEAAFAFLLRAVAVAVVIVAISLALKAIF